MGERSYADGEYAEKVRVRVGEGGKWTACDGELLWSTGYLGGVGVEAASERLRMGRGDIIDASATRRAGFGVSKPATWWRGNKRVLL